MAWRKKMGFLARILKFINYAIFKAILPYQAEIQKDIYLEHFALGIVMHPNVRIGHRVRIYHHVTLATETWVGSPHYIIIDDDAVIGVGAIVIARSNTDLHIGKGAKVGAGAVVTGDVAAGDVVVGVPARSVRRAKPEQVAHLESEEI